MSHIKIIHCHWYGREKTKAPTAEIPNTYVLNTKSHLYRSVLQLNHQRFTVFVIRIELEWDVHCTRNYEASQGLPYFSVSTSQTGRHVSTTSLQQKRDGSSFTADVSRARALEWSTSWVSSSVRTSLKFVTYWSVYLQMSRRQWSVIHYIVMITQKKVNWFKTPTCSFYLCISREV
jgi:hypothetical protein